MKGSIVRNKSVVILVLVCGFLMSIVIMDKTSAESKAKFQQAPKIAVVNVRYILQTSKKYTEFMTQMQSDVEKIQADLKALNEEIQKDGKALETRVKGSSDYLDMTRKLMEKEANLEAKKEFEKNLMSLREKQWTEGMYEKISESIKDLAVAKGISIVLDGNADLTREIPAMNSKELVLTIRTRKVMYYEETVDMTDEVLAAVDAK
jgi:Skp family chaperone for outer membrane proteins